VNTSLCAPDATLADPCWPPSNSPNMWKLCQQSPFSPSGLYRVDAMITELEKFEKIR